MNRIFRIIWSAARGAFVVVSEVARTRGKRLGGGSGVAARGCPPGVFVLTGLTAALFLNTAFAGGVQVANGNTKVYNAPNGVQVVDIATANAAGVSHNRYTQYNVDPSGQILNNNSALTKAGALQSQLGGQIVPNVNLTNEARVILNEVVGTSRSSLQGYTEVVGGKADVIVANPYGITCSGCGFINTDRATLTTGRPVLGSDGSVAGFDVKQGDILVNGTGLNGSNQNVLDLVARSVKIDGQVNAQDLKVVAGSNHYDYASRSVTAIAGDADKPLYAIDSTALGGMYANRIQLIATEGGVGVRMRGEAAASADDFTLDSAGRIEINSQVSAKRDVAVAYTGTGSDSGAITVSGTNAKLTATRDLSLQAKNGAGVTVSDGELVAGRDLSVSAASLVDTSSGGARYAARNTSVTTTGATTINGSVWGAGNDLTLTISALTIGGNAANLYSGGDAQAASGALNVIATAGDLTLANAVLQSAGNMNLTARLGGISTTANGSLTATGDMTVTANTAINHAGKLQGSRNVTLKASNTLAALNNSGLIQAGGALALGQSGHVLAIDNQHSGSMAADRLNVQATSLHNAGTLQASHGTAINAVSLNNDSTGQIIGSTVSGSGVSLTVSTDLTNLGTLQSAGDLTVATATLLNSGNLLALRSGNGALTLNATTFTNQGTIDGGSNLNLTTTDSINNTGAIQGGGAVVVDAGNTLTNGASGKIIGDAGLTVGSSKTTFSLNNSGLIQSALAMTLGNSGHAVTLLNNSGGVFKSGATLAVTGGNVTNQGNITVTSGTTMNVTSLTNGSTGNSAAALLVATDSNAAQSNLQVSGVLSNYGGMFANADLLVTAGGIVNQSTGGLSSLSNLRLTTTGTGTLDNYGAFYAGTALYLTATGGLIHNRDSGTIDSGGSLTTSSTDFTNNGAIVTVGDIDITATRSFTNETTNHGQTIGKELGAIIPGAVISSDKIANEGSFDAGMNAWIIDESYTQQEQYTGVTDAEMATLQKAQIIANGSGSSLSIHYGDSGLNKVGVISAHTVNIDGTGTFTNEDLTLNNYTYVRRWLQINDESSGDDDFLAYARTDPNRQGVDGDPDDDDNNSGNWTPGAGWTFVGHVSGSSFPSSLETEALAAAVQGAQVQSAVAVVHNGSGIYGNSFNFSGGTLVNASSLAPDDINQILAGGQTGGTLNTANGPGAASGSHASSVSGVTPPSWGIPAFSLPSNPNGLFVTDKDSSAKYLVETNPNFSVNSDFVGSDYLAERYGFNPDTVQKRLGDADYEANLIRQQLIAKTGSNIIDGYADEASQMKQLMDQAYNQGQDLGLTFGQALTPEQAANLTQDIVWMEPVVVDGQTVLAPHVYLAASTVDSLSSGAVIAANNTSITGAGLVNSGGTIVGSDSLSVKTTGDITNTSGTIKGGDVSLTSTGGSIRNETSVQGSGDDITYSTNIGKTAGIEATGSLNVDAAKDVSVIGANVTAGGDAAIKAGGNVTVDTIVDKTTRTSYTESGGGLNHSSTRTNVSTETNVGSQLNTGGNLNITSGGDTTLAGSQASVGGNLGVDAGGNFNVEARQDKNTVSTETKKSGLGVGGGVAGSQKTTTQDFTGTNVGSTLNVGGNADINAGKQMVLQGSDATIGGNADINARQGVSVLDGLDEKHVTSRTETTTFLKMDNSAGASAGAAAEASSTGASGSASASAEAEAHAGNNLKLAETSVTTTDTDSKNSVASNLNVGGNLNMKSDGTVTVQGSNVAAGGNLGIDAKDVNVLTGRSETTSTSSTNTTSIGIYSEANANAGASAGADNYGASTEVGVDAGTTTTFGARHETADDSSYTLTNSASSLKSGGDMSIKAQDTATFQGAQVSSGGDMSVEAQNINNVAAQDVSVSSSSSTSSTAGVYLGTSASASASGSVGSNGQASGEAGASAEASAGLRYHNEQASSTDSSITQVTNSFTAGGNVTRTAKDTIVDQGTQIDAGGDINQSATTIRDEAVSNQNSSTSDAQSHEARIGVYAGAEAGASSDGEASAEAGVGLKASYQGSISGESSSDSTAVTSGFKAGGNINSTSKDETVLRGAQFQAGGDVNLNAGSLDVQAARDTSSSSGTDHEISAEVKVSTGEAGAEAGYGLDTSSSESSTARAGSIAAGGNVNIKTGGDATFEGTNLSSGGDTNVDAGGNVNFNAATSTSKSSQTSASVEAGVSSSKEEGSGDKENSASLGVGVQNDQTSSSTAQGGSVSAGGNLKVSSGKDVNLEGTQVQSNGSTALSAGNKVNQKSITSTTSESGIKAGASVSSKTTEKAGTKENESEGSAELGGYIGGSQSTTKTSIKSAGGTLIQEKNKVN